MEKLYYAVCLFGELKSKEEFIKMCMPERLVPQFLSLVKKNVEKVVLIGADKDMEKVKVDKSTLAVEVFTDKIPPSVHMECEYKDMAEDVLSSVIAGKYDKLLLLSYWQYEYSPLEAVIENEIPHILSEDPMLDIVMVLLKSQIRTGITDLSNQKEAIDKAYQKYRERYKELLRVSVWGEGDSVLSLLHPKMEMGDFVTRAYCRDFCTWSDRLKEDFLYEFKEYGAIADIVDLDPDEFDRYVCGLKQLKNSKNIIQTFWDNFYQKYYESAEDRIIADYIEFIKRICVWDMDEDVAGIKLEMKKLYNSRAAKNISNVYQAPQNQMEYNRLEEEEGVKSKFYKSIQDYYKEDVPGYLLVHLNKKREKIEKQINQFL